MCWAPSRQQGAFGAYVSTVDKQRKHVGEIANAFGQLLRSQSNQFPTLYLIQVIITWK